MPLVGQGGTHRWTAEVVDGAQVPSDPATLQLIIKDPLGATILTVSLAGLEVVRDGVGSYHYDWDVEPDADLGTYQGIWSGLLNSVAVTNAANPDTVDVVTAGTINAEPLHLLTLAELREHVTTALSDDALEQLRNAEEQAILARIGPIGQVIDTRWPRGDSIIMLGRVPGAIQSIVEYWDGYLDADAVTLAADDYLLDRYSLRRRNTGTNPRGYWADRTVITFTPADDTARRVKALIALVQLDVREREGAGVVSRTVGAHTVQYRASSGPGSSSEARDAIWAELENATEPAFA